MIARIVTCSSILLLAAGTLLAAGPERPSTTFHISDATGIPGHVLTPGAYTLQVIDHLSDRYVLKVSGKGDPQGTVFLGIPNKDMSGTTGVAYWKTPVEGATYMRGWDASSLPTPLVFAYPKNDAVAIAKANGAQVPAIDPASDGLVSKASLSRDEMHIITLWLLTPTSVGPNSPGGISAARYQQVARVERKPVIARLPHTASELPLIELLGLFALMGAAGLGTRRLAMLRK
jgi:hypothetical protein